jgi:hypothetical protein
MSTALACPMCGFTYVPEAHASCNGCPIQKGCHMVCCPACGYQTIDHASSSVVRMAEAGRSGWKRLRRRFLKSQTLNVPQNTQGSTDCLLTAVLPGREVCVAGFTSGISDERKARLQAYGLVSGQVVRVLQHNPVTVVVIEHLELAMETDLARSVLVKNN